MFMLCLCYVMYVYMGFCRDHDDSEILGISKGPWLRFHQNIDGHVGKWQKHPSK